MRKRESQSGWPQPGEASQEVPTEAGASAAEDPHEAVEFLTHHLRDPRHPERLRQLLEESFEACQILCASIHEEDLPPDEQQRFERVKEELCKGAETDQGSARASVVSNPKLIGRSIVGPGIGS
jgi:hypothetical protein